MMCTLIFTHQNVYLSEFASTIRDLSSCGGEYKLHLIISKIELPLCVLNILVPALQNINIGRFTLYTRLDNAGYVLLCNLLQSSPSIGMVCLNHMKIKGFDMNRLSQAACNSSSLKTFILRQCSLDCLSFFPMISNHLRQVLLPRLGIGSQGAMVIAQCLATNPQLEVLDLEKNLLNDIDAEVIAHSLGSNTHLIKLYLRGNCFTGDGIKTLIRSIYDEESLNAMYDANATCQLVLFNENEMIPNGIDETVLGMNKRIPLSQYFPLIPNSIKMRCSKRVPSGDVMEVVKLMYMEGSKKLKIFHALRGGKEGKFCVHYLNGVSLEVLPQVLSFLHDCHKLQLLQANKVSRRIECNDVCINLCIQN